MSSLRCIPASDRTPAELVELFHRGFEGYPVHFHFTVETFMARMRMDLVDFTRSRIVQRDGEDLGLALLSPRGGEMRVAAMGIVKAGRGQGVGQWLMQRILEESPERQVELEVLDGNTPAIALYESCGFQRLEKLPGFAAEAPVGEANRRLVEVPLDRVARAVLLHGDEDLPWQCSAPSLLTLAHPHSAWQLGPASLILGDRDAVELRILALLTQKGQRRAGHGRALLAAMFARFPDRRWFVPPIVPERYADFFLSSGLREHPLSQWRMRRDRSGSDA